MKRMHVAGMMLLTYLLMTSGCSGWLSKRALQNGTNAMKHGDFATAVKQFERASHTITDSPDLYFDLGRSYQQLTPPNLDLAIKNYKAALNLKPTDTDCMICIGEIYLQRQQWDEATAIYEQAGGQAPDARVLTALAQAAKGAGHTDAARIYLIRALIANHSCAPALYDLGCLYRDVYMIPAEAIEQFELYLRTADSTDPRVPKAHEKVSALKQVVGRQALLPAGTKRDPGAAVKLVAEGDKQRTAKQLPKAEKAYRDALAADPLSQDAAFNLALICKDKKNLPEALKLLLRAASMEPLRQATLVEAAQTAIAVKDYPTASRMLDRLIATSPTFAPAYASMAVVRLAQGQKSAARVYAEQFVRLAPPGPDRDHYEKWAATLPR